MSCWCPVSVVTPLRFSQTPCPPRLFDRFGPPLRRVPALSVAAGATTPCPGTQCAALTSRGYTTPTTLTQFIKTNLRLHSKSRPNLESRAPHIYTYAPPGPRDGPGAGGEEGNAAGARLGPFGRRAGGSSTRRPRRPVQGRPQAGPRDACAAGHHGGATYACQVHGTYRTQPAGTRTWYVPYAGRSGGSRQRPC